jgi:hypothetical protein
MQQPKFENNNSQELLLNKFGEVLESDNQLFPVQRMANLTALDCFPLVASMFDSFLNLKIGDTPVTVPGVSPSCGFLNGFYDFSFSKIGTVEDFKIKWIIEDCTDKYTYLKDEMQIHNNAVIKAEHDRRSKK